MDRILSSPITRPRHTASTSFTIMIDTFKFSIIIIMCSERYCYTSSQYSLQCINYWANYISILLIPA